MDARTIALIQAGGRVAIGASYVLAPGLAGRMWIGPDADSRAVKVVTRALGARDLAIGLGVIAGLERGSSVKGWLGAGALADAVDFAGSLVAGDSLPSTSRRGALVIAGGSAIAGAVLARALGDEPAPDVS